MKKLYFIITAACIASLGLSSCKKVLQKTDLQSSNASDIYNDSLTTTFSINYVYSQNQPTWFGNNNGYIGTTVPTYNITEECSNDNAVVKGTITKESVGDLPSSSAITTNYGKIRLINMFIRDVRAGTLAQATKNRFVAQAMFWRAYRYFELVKLYGGVPLVLKPLDAVGAENKLADLLPRNTTTETFKQIKADLDTAIMYLPAKWTNDLDYGRITKGAAQAFQGRVLLTWASPQFTPTSSTALWQAAYDANTAAITTLNAAGYGLYSKWDNTMWTVKGSSGGVPSNPEAVWVTEFNTSSADAGTRNNTYTQAAIPKYVGNGGGSFQPTVDMVKAFPMADGKVGAASKYAYSDQYFFENRDPRFNQTIAYNGCNWPLIGNSAMRLWTYNYNNGKSFVSTEINPTSTGFYLRKAVDGTIASASLPYSGTDWIELRYAEVLLNQAEAAAELGNTTLAYNNLVLIRKRAGLEAGTGDYGLGAISGHDDMIKAIMFEREIEFAYEGKRYWDLRRRKLFESTLNGLTRKKMTINLVTQTGNTTDYLAATRDNLAATAAGLHTLYTSQFTVAISNIDTYPIAIQTADYFFGIPTNTINNNPQIQQNNTWGGPFDPLK